MARCSHSALAAGPLPRTGLNRMVVERQVSADAPRDSCGSILDRDPCKVGVAHGRLRLVVAQELADYREALAEGQGTRRKAVP